jgi:hypothetical protein
MGYITYRKRIGFNLILALLVVKIEYHICSTCGQLSIDLFGREFIWIFRDRAYSEEDPISPLSEDDINLIFFNNKLSAAGFYQIYNPDDFGNELRILKFMNYEEKIITINKGGAINVMKSDTIDEFIKSYKK